MYLLKIIAPTFLKLSGEPLDSSLLPDSQKVFIAEGTILEATELRDSKEGHSQFIILPSKKLLFINDKVTAWVFNAHFECYENISLSNDKIVSITNKINSAGLKIVKDSEGLRLKAYLCPSNIWTIGYGSTFYLDGKSVKSGDTLESSEEAEKLLLQTLAVFEKGVEKAVTVPLNSNQFSALVSLAFNIGLGAFRDSTLLKVLNQKNYDEAANQILRWNKGGGRVLPGLVTRRKKEYDLFRKV